MLKSVFLVLTISIAGLAFAQHEHTTVKKDSVLIKEMVDSIKHEKGLTQPNTPMSHAFSLHLPMNRNGSGTGWLPDASPMYGKMFHSKNWMYMIHGNAFLRYNNQDFTNEGSRGDDEFDAPHWVMFMGQRNAGGKALFHFSAMLSLDALTGGNDGYPLLFQTGETHRGRPLVDRQHPHDFFSELSVSYAYSVTEKADVFLYLGYPGEPALGPVAFMHRPSALPNPDAPLSHHWTDATHITFGVATFGIRLGKMKLEASSFTGREPDEKRYDFDTPRFDSWSGRFSYNPTTNWALQVSHAYLHHPEVLHPENSNRTTASAIYSYAFANKSWMNLTALWGRNKSVGSEGENAFLIEGSWTRKKLTLHGRYEYVEKSVEELLLDPVVYGQEAIFAVHASTFGVNYDLLQWGAARISAGGQYTLYLTSEKLAPLYGEKPMAFEVYLRLSPGLVKPAH